MRISGEWIRHADKYKFPVFMGYRKSYSMCNYDIEIWYPYPFNLVVRYWRDLMFIIIKRVYINTMVSFGLKEKPRDGCAYKRDFIMNIFTYLGVF